MLGLVVGLHGEVKPVAVVNPREVLTVAGGRGEAQTRPTDIGHGEAVIAFLPTEGVGLVGGAVGYVGILPDIEEVLGVVDIVVGDISASRL